MGTVYFYNISSTNTAMHVIVATEIHTYIHTYIHTPAVAVTVDIWQGLSIFNSRVNEFTIIGQKHAHNHMCLKLAECRYFMNTQDWLRHYPAISIKSHTVTGIYIYFY